VAQKADQRNLPFLRTAWRTEHDPAVRAVLADSIYQSDPRDYLGSRALLDTFTTGDEVYGRLRRLARELKVELPCVGSLTSLAAEGNGEALTRLVELARASGSDSGAQRTISVALADVARSAPDELLVSLRVASAADREAAVRLLLPGVAQQQDTHHPLRPAPRPSAVARVSQDDGLHGGHRGCIRAGAGRHARAADGCREGAPRGAGQRHRERTGGGTTHAGPCSNGTPRRVATAGTW